jgi:uncharacterized protein (TIGR02757 family)
METYCEMWTSTPLSPLGFKNKSELIAFLDEKAEQYNSTEFIQTDPIQLPHRFSKKEDIEIIGFLVSTIAWGNRTSIIKNGEKLIEIMENSPFEFIQNYNDSSAKDLHFVHRTFNTYDLDFFFRSLKNIYLKGGLEKAFSPHSSVFGSQGRIINFRTEFLETLQASVKAQEISEFKASPQMRRQLMRLRNFSDTIPQ